MMSAEKVAAVLSGGLGANTGNKNASRTLFDTFIVSLMSCEYYN